MNLGEIFRTALGEIRYHKLRSFLTLLGIMLGSACLMFMTSLIDGIFRTVWAGFRDLGFDGVMYVEDRDGRDLREKAIFARSRGLQPEDAAIVFARREHVSDVAPALFDEQIVRRGSVERKARVMGVTAPYAVIRGRTTTAGRFLNDLDEHSFARVCVLGYRLNARLFGSEDPIGKFVALAGRPFRVVGVGQHLGNTFFNDDDFTEEMEGIYVPLATLRKFYTGEDQALSFMAVKTNDIERLSDMKSEVTSSLRIAHRGAEDFRVQNIAEEILRARKDIGVVLTNWRVVLGSISAISLLVGGIGLLSVLLISIGERLYEIGLRKAIGATDADIFAQFLMESVVLSLIGGLLGILFAIGLIKAIAGFFPFGLPVQLPGLIFSIAIALALGILYGIYPALKASRMEPVEALRSTA